MTNVMVLDTVSDSEIYEPRSRFRQRDRSASVNSIESKVTLNMLWGIPAALFDLPCAARELRPDIKAELRKQVEEA